LRFLKLPASAGLPNLAGDCRQIAAQSPARNAQKKNAIYILVEYIIHEGGEEINEQQIEDFVRSRHFSAS
jgi:hypothetical protein